MESLLITKACDFIKSKRYATGAFMRLVLIALTMLIGTILSAEENPLDIRFYGSFLHTDRIPKALFFFKEIEKNDSFELRRAVRNHDVNTIVLASNGGSVWEGLSMAGIIFDKGMTTYVPELSDDMGCYSACAYMFFAGAKRKVDGILAVHQMGGFGSEADEKSKKVKETQQQTQFTVSEIIGFLNEFGTPPFVYERMFRSRNFYVFEEDEIAQLETGEVDGVQVQQINSFFTDLVAYLEKKAGEKERPENQSHERFTFDNKNKEQVRNLQSALKAAGCNAGIVDGIWGSKTRLAAILFAKTAKLPFSADSFINEYYWSKLSSAPSKFCPVQKTAPSQNPRVPKFTKGRPTKIHLHWRLTCKGASGARSVPIFGLVSRYNPKTGNFSFTITDRDGFKGTNSHNITDGQIFMFGKSAPMRNNFRYFRFTEASCPDGMIGEALK